MLAEIDLRLAPEPEAVLTARHALDRLADLLPPAKLEDVRLVVSELVTNSIRHAGLSPNERISLKVEASTESVRGKVCDPGPGFEAPSEPRPRPDLRGGWGLPIVDRVSDRWGVKRDGLMCVWFESTEGVALSGPGKQKRERCRGHRELSLHSKMVIFDEPVEVDQTGYSSGNASHL